MFPFRLASVKVKTTVKQYLSKREAARIVIDERKKSKLSLTVSAYDPVVKAAGGAEIKEVNTCRLVSMDINDL